MIRLLFGLIVIIIVAVVAAQFIKPKTAVAPSNGIVSTATPTSTSLQASPTGATPTPTPTTTLIQGRLPAYKSKVLIAGVPFTSQAPFAEWKDPRFQEGCEEASSLMAVYWARNITSIDKTKARDEIIAMAAYQQERWGEARDTSAEDTASRIIAGYFNFFDNEVIKNMSLQDIKYELLQGRLVIVPTNGQALNNPHFTAPGPDRHMIVVRGYDDNLGTFITNDPGIKEGELYTYPQQLFFDAIRDYPTGYNLPIVGDKKVMIVIKKP